MRGMKMHVSSDLLSYLETALRSSSVYLDITDEYHGIPKGATFLDYFSVSDFSDGSVSLASNELNYFLDSLDEAGLLEKALGYGTLENIAHNFWLTRNGHGAGFRGGDYGVIGDQLTEIAHNYDPCELVLGDDGKIYLLT